MFWLYMGMLEEGYVGNTGCKEMCCMSIRLFGNNLLFFDGLQINDPNIKFTFYKLYIFND